eukprot:CAMPEP_0173169524 /NCGR_PEP_ID=MMETSP1141-20130122/754_1 /TAXON_ID=483371 /ORGANISM="non described non described, Strain CCMP2298" /LENGTH=135 /DNA_ID=CAMNT_0014091365 /DNA_START=197 /DNA_END=604 /DNA_ORIENTATION=+
MVDGGGAARGEGDATGGGAGRAGDRGLAQGAAVHGGGYVLGCVTLACHFGGCVPHGRLCPCYALHRDHHRVPLPSGYCHHCGAVGAHRCAVDAPSVRYQHLHTPLPLSLTLQVDVRIRVVVRELRRTQGFTPHAH